MISYATSHYEFAFIRMRLHDFLCDFALRNSLSFARRRTISCDIARLLTNFVSVKLRMACTVFEFFLGIRTTDVSHILYTVNGSKTLFAITLKLLLSNFLHDRILQSQFQVKVKSS